MNALTSVLAQPAALEAPRETETSLLEAARDMNKEALIQIFDQYSPALYSYAFRLCNDALKADYVVGDVFAKLLDQLANGGGPKVNLRSYLYEMAYHLIVDESRVGHRETPLEVLEFIPHDGYSAFLSLENQILFDAVVRAIRNDLTDDQRHVIILRFFEGFSLKETAIIIRKSVNYVKVIQNRAIAALRKALNGKVLK